MADSTAGSRQERPLAIHCLDDGVIISRNSPVYSQIFFRALAGLASAQASTDKPVDTKLVVQLCNRMDTAAAEEADKIGFRNSDDP
ncbi:hypothetical protein [Rhizobium sp. WYCCWR 11128]|uniref:hypothetical protein n=1 Tax=Rhizobium sp. WYCCWR 11128 TaxID=2749832 RepID=UPI0015D3CA44|nr:hypothetical protein [Rhizobium sp. WYCCWR 11128]NYT32486.1 hypothetical protein [Rhizobium sp. WYCCWR 11128]